MSPTREIELIVRIHDDEPGHQMWAEVLDLPGCFASGDSLDELREALQEAIALYLNDNPDDGRIAEMQQVDPNAPKAPLEIGEMRVKVPA